MSIIRQRRGGTRVSDPMLGSKDAGPYHDHPTIGMLHMGGRYLEFIFMRNGDFDRSANGDWDFRQINGGTDTASLSANGGGLLVSAGQTANQGGQYTFLGGGAVRPIALRNASSWGFGAFFGQGDAANPQTMPVHYFIGFTNTPGSDILTSAGDVAAVANLVGFHFKSGVNSPGRPSFVARGASGGTQTFPYSISSAANTTEKIGAWWGFRLDTNDTVSAYRVEDPAGMVDEVKPITTVVQPTRLSPALTAGIDMTIVFAVVHTVTAVGQNGNYFGVWDGCITRGTFIRSV